VRIPQSSKAEQLSSEINHSALDSALQRCGSSWTAAQAHGLICSRLALQGANAVDPWLQQVLQDTDPQNALRQECAGQLRVLHDETLRQLAARDSEFQLLLPGVSEGAASRTEALAHWCEGYLHGIVIRADGDELKARLAAEPLSDIIRDMLQITRAEADPDADDETNEIAYAELLEYLRVAAQLVYEELAEFRRPPGISPDAGSPRLTH
jgi:uncharacterized protein YgfB (UPF0149 family)